MRARALGELLARPSPFTSTTRTHMTPLAQRYISNTRASAPTASPQDTASTTATTATTTEPSAAPASPRDAANAAIDSLITPAGTPQPAPTYNRVFGSNFSTPGRHARGAPPGLKWDDMYTDELQRPSFSNKTGMSLAQQQKEVFENYPRVGPAYGRAINLDPSRGRDIVRGIGMLGSLMARNKVKADVNKQRFHERPGLKRKRLNSLRWRARFKSGFQSVTGRVVELTRKGW